MTGRGKNEDYSYEFAAGSSGAASVRWNGIGTLGRQCSILVFSIILARILGPTAYGIIAQANIYMLFTTLLLDQGLTAALVSERTVTRRTAGAAATLNLALAAFFIVCTVPLAAPVAVFLNTPALAIVLPVLALGLLFKSITIVPRMLLTRNLDFRAIAAADLVSALVGGATGLAAALAGFGYWSIVIQFMVSDFVTVVIIYASARPPLPNFHLRSLASSMGFGTRVFAANLLSFASRNIDNLLVGRLFGTEHLAYYSLAYRVLLTPIQLIAQTVTRVLFPAIAKLEQDKKQISNLILRSTQGISFIAFPLMSFVAVSAHDTVLTILGSAWLPAVAVVQVLSITGARQAITAINAPVLMGMGRSDIHLKFNLLAAVIQIAGITLGLWGGILGVAIGYTIAGIVLTPIILIIQKRLTDVPLKSQASSILPSFHAALWLAVPYLILFLIPLPSWIRILVGGLIGAALYLGVIRFAHRKTWDSLVKDFRVFYPKGR